MKCVPPTHTHPPAADSSNGAWQPQVQVARRGGDSAACAPHAAAHRTRRGGCPAAAPPAPWAPAPKAPAPLGPASLGRAPPRAPPGTGFPWGHRLSLRAGLSRCRALLGHDCPGPALSSAGRRRGRLTQPHGHHGPRLPHMLWAWLFRSGPRLPQTLQPPLRRSSRDAIVPLEEPKPIKNPCDIPH